MARLHAKNAPNARTVATLRTPPRPMMTRTFSIPRVDGRARLLNTRRRTTSSWETVRKLSVARFVTRRNIFTFGGRAVSRPARIGAIASTRSQAFDLTLPPVFASSFSSSRWVVLRRWASEPSLAAKMVLVSCRRCCWTAAVGLFFFCLLGSAAATGAGGAGADPLFAAACSRACACNASVRRAALASVPGAAGGSGVFVGAGTG
mmetsp:Transcript_18846/g.56218  ORF Transcript_18846/g.56218 Transcript_18846/m.56218 type:complete len:205 (-) Transcript_18846:364-978(-)